MKNILTSVIASLLILPNLVQAGVRDQYNQSLSQESARNSACLELWNQAQFEVDTNYRYHVDPVGNIKYMWYLEDFNNNKVCDYDDQGMVNVEKDDGNLITYIYHIEDDGLVKYSSMQTTQKPRLSRRVYSFR